MPRLPSGANVPAATTDSASAWLLIVFFFFKQKTAYEITVWLEFRRVLFRSDTTHPAAIRALEQDVEVERTLLIAAGWVVSRTWNEFDANVCRITSGARLDPPIPSSTMSENSSETCSVKPSSSCATCRIRPAASSQPSHWASSFPVQTVASRAQMRRTSS